MAVGTGIECINLKKAKYNRDMRMAAEAASAREIQMREEAYARARAEQSRSYAGEARRSSYDAPADEGYSFKDVAGAIGEELLGALASYRRKKARERARAPKYICRNVKSKTAFPVSVIGYIIVFSVIAMFLVLGNSQINEATLYANTLENEINEAINTCEMLSAEVNSRSDAIAVEDYAVNVLGLVKNTDVAKTYVSISGEDKIVLNGTENVG